MECTNPSSKVDPIPLRRERLFSSWIWRFVSNCRPDDTKCQWGGLSLQHEWTCACRVCSVACGPWAAQSRLPSADALSRRGRRSVANLALRTFGRASGAVHGRRAGPAPSVSKTASGRLRRRSDGSRSTISWTTVSGWAIAPAG